MWRRRESRPHGLLAQLPLLISLTLLLSVLTFFTQVISPFGTTLAAEMRRPHPSSPLFGAFNPAAIAQIAFLNQAPGVASILVHTSLLMGVVLPVVRRWTLPLGSLVLVFGLNALLMTLMRERSLAPAPSLLTASAVLAGLGADLLLHHLWPSAERRGAFRLFALTVPSILFMLYFLIVLLFGGGIWWTLHLWLGAIVLAGLTGWLISYLVVPPVAPSVPPR